MDHGPIIDEPAIVTGRSDDGAIRQVGVEIEFVGLSAEAAVRALAAALGGHVESEDPHAFRLVSSRLGDLAVDLDLRYVHPQRHGGLQGLLGRRTAAWLGTAVSRIVPHELITRPLPVERLPEVDAAVAALRAAGARGDGVILSDGLSLHFNVEPPARDAATILAFLKAYLSLEAALRQEIARGDPRLVRVLAPDFPPAYVEAVLAPGYWPDLPDLIADYLHANPTRKRGLDMLPLFTFLDEARVRAVLPREKIGRRPVLHYRLPLAHLSDPGWGVVADWERWLRVERLAADIRAGNEKPPHL